MSRALWFVAGAAAGTYGVWRARRAAEALTPDGMRDRAAGASLGAQLLAEEIRQGMVEKETELRGRLRLVGREEQQQLPPGATGAAREIDPHREER